MADNLSYYKLLGVQEDCSEDALKKSYRSLSLQHHPDKFGGNEEKFKDIVQAYNILSNPVTRRQYDLGFDILSTNFEEDIYKYLEKHQRLFEDISSRLGRLSHVTKERSEDTIEVLEVDIVEVCNGTIREVTIDKKVNCLCKDMQVTITACNDCTKCRGKGMIEVQKKIVIEIKPGILEGQEILRINEGDEEPNKSAGDRIFKVQYMKGNSEFRYKPFRDIIYRATIQLWEAVWFIQIPVKTPNLYSNLLLTKNTQGRIIKNGDKMFVMNEGVPDYFNPKRRGRLIVEFNVELPTQLSEEQVREISELFGINLIIDKDELQVLFTERLSVEEESLMKNSSDLFPEHHYPETKKKGKWKNVLTKFKNKFYIEGLPIWDYYTSDINDDTVDINLEASSSTQKKKNEARTFDVSEISCHNESASASRPTCATETLSTRAIEGERHFDETVSVTPKKKLMKRLQASMKPTFLRQKMKVLRRVVVKDVASHKERLKLSKELRWMPMINRLRALKLKLLQMWKLSLW